MQVRVAHTDTNDPQLLQGKQLQVYREVHAGLS